MKTDHQDVVEDIARVAIERGVLATSLAREPYRREMIADGLKFPWKAKWAELKKRAQKLVDQRQSGKFDAVPEAEGESIDYNPDKGTITYGKDGALYDERQIKTVEELMEACKVQTDGGFVITEQDVRTWNVTAFTKEKNGERQARPWQNFRVNLKLSRDIPRLELSTAMDEIRRQAEISEFRFPRPSSYDPSGESNELEIALYDVHIGKLARQAENFDSDQNLEIIEARFRNALMKLMARASRFDFDRIVFVLGNDYFNSDSCHNATTRGTPQHEAADWRVTYRIGCQMALDGVDVMRQFRDCPIKFIVVPGNHDSQRSFFLGEHIKGVFSNRSDIEVDNGDNPRKYHKFGRNFIGFAHGNDEKDAALPMLMTTQGLKHGYGRDVRFCEWHLGHLHKRRKTKQSVIIGNEDSMDENYGINVRRISSICSTDSWHESKGYVGNVKAGEAFLWNHDEGLLANFNCFV